jgi:hypothetical protein
MRVRMTGASKVPILRLLESLGPACAEYLDKHVRNIASRRIQCGEIWQFCYAKSKNVPQGQGTFYEPRGATEPSNEDGNAPIHSPDEWLQ